MSNANFLIKDLLTSLKSTQHEMCEFSFIWALLNSVTWETVSQTALKCMSRSEHNVIFGKGVCAIKHSSSEKVYASLGEQMSVLTISMLLYIKEDARNWVHKMVS